MKDDFSVKTLIITIVSTVIFALSFMYTFAFMLANIVDPENISKWSASIVPFTAIISHIGIFYFGQFYIRDEIKGKVRMIDRDLNKRYNALVNFLDLARLVVKDDTGKIIQDYVNDIRKKAEIPNESNPSETPKGECPPNNVG